MPSDGGEEAVAPGVPPVPAKPTPAEQGEHYGTGHAAYRSWCVHCVRGRGRVSPHVSVPEGELLEVGVDYAYMGPEGSQVTILVRGLRWKRLLPRSDNELALLAFLRAAAAGLEGVC